MHQEVVFQTCSNKTKYETAYCYIKCRGNQHVLILEHIYYRTFCVMAQPILSGALTHFLFFMFLHQRTLLANSRMFYPQAKLTHKTKAYKKAGQPYTNTPSHRLMD